MRTIRHSKSLFIHIALLFGLATTAHAQVDAPAISSGCGIGYHWTPEGAINFPDPIGAPASITGKGKVTGRSIYMELAIPDLAGNRNLSFIARLRATRLEGKSGRDLPSVKILLADSSVPVDQIIRSERTFSIDAAYLDLMGEYGLPWGFIVRGGVSIGYRNITWVASKQRLIEPAGARFVNSLGFPMEDDGRVIVFYNNRWPGQRRIALGLSTALGYSIGIGGPSSIHPEIDFSIVPEIGYRFELNAPASGYAWPRGELGAALTMRFTHSGTPPAETPILPSDAYHIAIPPRAAPPSASIDLFSVDPNGGRVQNAVLRTRTTLRKRTIVLPSTILFENGSASVPERFTSQPDRISSDSIARFAPHQAHDRLLDLIGSRLAASPHTAARIIGSIAEGEPSRLARTRAERVRAYLIDRWRCSPSQLTIASARKKSATGSVRIEIPSLPDATTIASEWHERRIDASPIEIEPDVKGIAMRRWSIEILRNEKLLARQRSDEPEKELITLDMLLREMSAGGSPAPLVARFVVEDSVGRSFSASDELPFVVDSSAALLDSSVATYVLLHDEESRHIERSIRTIASAISADARVIVAPLRDSDASSTMAREAVVRIREVDRRGSVTMGDARYAGGGGSDGIEIVITHGMR